MQGATSEGQGQKATKRSNILKRLRRAVRGKGVHKDAVLPCVSVHELQQATFSSRVLDCGESGAPVPMIVSHVNRLVD